MEGLPTAKDWRERLPPHPALEKFPMAPLKEQGELAWDIRKHGLLNAIVISADGAQLIDGRTRLDALAVLKKPIFNADGTLAVSHRRLGPKDDPQAQVISLNIYRRHLTRAQRQAILDEMVIAKQEQSNRAIAALVKVSPNTVQSARRQLESTGAIAPVTHTIGSDGRACPTAATTSAKQQEIAELLKANPTQSDYQIAALANVTHRMVSQARRRHESTGQIAQVSNTVGVNGRTYPRQPARVELSPDPDIAAPRMPTPNRYTFDLALDVPEDIARRILDELTPKRAARFVSEVNQYYERKATNVVALASPAGG